MTRFCIVTIHWNDFAGLKLTYQSLASQTYGEFRWIVVDGASTDGAVEWLARLEEPRAEVSSEKDRGIYDAMNKGLERAMASDGYTLFLNAGDTLASPTVLENVARAIEASATRPAFVYGDFFWKYADGALVRRQAKPIELLYRGLPASHQSMYFANERLREVRFRDEYKLSADYCMVIEFLQGVDPASGVLRLPIPLCIFDTCGVSHKRRFDAIKEDAQIRMRFLKLPRFKAYVLYLLHYLHTHSKIVRNALTHRAP